MVYGEFKDGRGQTVRVIKPKGYRALQMVVISGGWPVVVKLSPARARELRDYLEAYLRGIKMKDEV